VPDATSVDVDTARSILEQSGFKVKVVKQPTSDPSQEGVVLDQSPAPNTQAKQGATVTIFVGHFTGQTTDTTTTP
jgi:beta-lactam-binding protein with PASTA domain